MALNKLGKGTWKQIMAEIDTTKWGCADAGFSIRSMLSTRAEFQKDGSGKYWIYKPAKPKSPSAKLPARAKSMRHGIKPASGRGLYFITLNYGEAIFPDLPFKVGRTDDAAERIKKYGLWLPYDPIKFESFFPIPQCIDLRAAEKYVQSELLNLIDMKVTRIYTKGQVEWFAAKVNFSRPNVTKLAKVIDNLVSDFIKKSNATQKPSASSAKKPAGAPSNRAARRTFASLKIPVGSELVYTKDGGVKCATVDGESNVRYNGKTYTISGLVKDLSKRPSANGFMYFTYKGRRLDKI